MKPEVLIVKGELLGFDLLLGLDAILRQGRVHLTDSGEVHFLAKNLPRFAVIKIDEPDFNAVFDSQKKEWTASWEWADGQTPGQLKNWITEYLMAKHIWVKYKKELELWLKNGWLVPYLEKELGGAKTLIPLMALVQVNQNKVKPIKDFRELNGYIDTFTANANICAQKLVEW